VAATGETFWREPSQAGGRRADPATAAVAAVLCEPRLRRRVQRIVVGRQDAALRCNMVSCVARHLNRQAGGPRSASPSPSNETAPVGARCTLRVACLLSVACCTVHSHRAQAAGPAGKFRLGASAHESSCVSASCDTCQDFHARHASKPLPSCTVSNDGLSSAQQTQARALEHMHARARAHAHRRHSRRQAARHCKRDERDQDDSEPRRRPIRRPVCIPMRHMARSRKIAALAREGGHPSPFGNAHLWRVRVLRVAIQEPNLWC
jgi:hypothetical protein